MSLSSAAKAAVKPLLADDVLDEVFGGSVGVDGALETPPPIAFTLVVEDECKGRPSLS